MKIGRVNRNGQISLAVQTEYGIVDVEKAAKSYNEDFPASMRAVIEGGGETVRNLEHTIQRAISEDSSEFTLSANMYTWEPVIENPEKIICVGLNYQRHALETGSPVPTRPVLFSKFNNALTGHDSEVVIPEDTSKLDYEAELAIVIGNEGRNISEEDALNYVFGYTVANDVSARDLQMVTSQWLLGKTLDGFAPIGPFIATADSVLEPNHLRITCKRNNEIVQDSNTGDMIFNCRQIISYCSKFMTLKPGDLILTGTPEGVIMGLPSEQQRWLERGETILTSIENIGELKFTIGENRRLVE